MNINWQTLSKTIQTQLLESHAELADFTIINASPIERGDNQQSFQLHTNLGNFFLKLHPKIDLPIFQAESHSLNRLKQSLTITVPKVFAQGSFEGYSWLLLAFLPMTSQGDDLQRGKDLAMLHHQINPDKQFGWFENNFIGQTPQQNQWHTNWVEFYASQRLQPQLTLAKQNGAGDLLLAAGHKLLNQFPILFKDYQPEASLLHGDLWNGNSLFLDDGEAIFFDPASYYGDRETDVALTELFGGFSPQFYQGYQQVFPLNTGYEKRKPLYNSYHLLNHFNLFGGQYEQQALKQIQQCLQYI